MNFKANVERVVNLTDSSKNIIYNFTLEEALAAEDVRWGEVRIVEGSGFTGDVEVGIRGGEGHEGQGHTPE